MTNSEFVNPPIISSVILLVDDIRSDRWISKSDSKAGFMMDCKRKSEFLLTLESSVPIGQAMKHFFKLFTPNHIFINYNRMEIKKWQYLEFTKNQATLSQY
ncbi:TPA: hypothetical protein ACQKXP_000535, partial [Staphylococcus aureus]